MKNILLFLFVLMTCCYAFAQQGEIIYREFDPPLLIQGDYEGGGNYNATIAIDVDENGGIDYEIRFGLGKGEFYLYQVGYSNTKFREIGLWESDTIIPYDESWTDIPLYGHWTDWSVIVSDDLTGEYYDKVGFYKVIDGQKYYGWIHRYGNEDFSFPFLKWVAVDKIAFCTIPDYPLHWGQTSTTDDIGENEATAFAILYPNPATGFVNITGKDLKRAEVFNTLGQCVATVKGQGEQLTVDISNLPAGVYFVNITDGEGCKCVRKVIKE